jgi:hypothetical protein
MDKKFEGLIFGLDFDGTVVAHSFPEIGPDCPGSVATLRWIVENGGKLVLNTMRSDRPDRKYLAEAVAWFERNAIPLYGINCNPTQRYWTSSPKVYAHIYIDDAAMGCPLKHDPDFSGRPFVDWDGVLVHLDNMLLKPEPIINGAPIVTE